MTILALTLVAGLALSRLDRGATPSAGSGQERPPAPSEDRIGTSADASAEADRPAPPASTGARRVLTNADFVSNRTKPATARVYTNADLDQLHELRGETGVLSQPATPSAPRHAEDAGEKQRDGAARYWRREAEKVRERVAKLAEQAEAVRERIAAAEALARQGRRRASERDTDGTSLRARLLSLEGRIRLIQDDLEERARREGALPGWLR